MPGMVRHTGKESLSDGEILDKNFYKAIGLLHEVCVTGRKINFYRYHWGSLAHNQRLFEKVKRFIETENTRSGFLPDFMRDAQRILGEENVFSNYDVVSAWGGDDRLLRREYQAPFEGRELLAQCALDNEMGSLWKLIFIQGLSIAEQVKRSQYHTYSVYGSGIGIANCQDSFTASVFQREGRIGYCLINFKPMQSSSRSAPPETALEALLSLGRLGEKPEFLLGEGCVQEEIAILVNRGQDTMQDDYLEAVPRKDEKLPTLAIRYFK